MALDRSVKKRAAAPVAEPGLRVRGKVERRRRLRDAARKIFLERGYEAATTREIAALADVAIGTLFVYAPEKRDLLFIIMNDDLDSMLDKSVLEMSPDLPLIKRLMHIFRPLYELFETNAEICRYGLREIFLFQGEPKSTLGPEAMRVYDRISRYRTMIAGMIDDLSRHKRFANPVSGETVARAMMWLHWGQTQRWLSQPKPSAKDGLRELQRLFALVIAGLGPVERDV